MDDNTKIAIIGLGYVGLPLAVHFGVKFHTTGFDLKDNIIENCEKFEDPTGEVSKKDFASIVNSSLLLFFAGMSAPHIRMMTILVINNYGCGK